MGQAAQKLPTNGPEPCPLTAHNSLEPLLLGSLTLTQPGSLQSPLVGEGVLLLVRAHNNLGLGPKQNYKARGPIKGDAAP